MSQSAITLAFENYKAQEATNGQVLKLNEFVLANVPGLDPSLPVDRNETVPSDEYIVHRQAVSKEGVVNQNTVAYSITMGSDVGDFDFNWLGLRNKETGLLGMVVHVPTQRKIATAAGQQGNALTRSFLMEYDGAAEATGITTPAESWQIDFTARLFGIDDMQRLVNRDLYGAGAFLGDSFLVTKSGSVYSVTAGVGYIGGLRAELSKNQIVNVTMLPTKIWADVSYQGTVTSDWQAVISLIPAETMVDYVDAAGFAHYVFAVAAIDNTGAITDLRPKGSVPEQESQDAINKLNDALAKHEKSRNHPDASLTEKGFVQLSSATESTSEILAATPKAVKAVRDLAAGKYTAEDATTSKRGLVQLSSATDSMSETLAATPKAVKTVHDLAASKAPVNSPALTGHPTAPTPVDSAVGQEIATAAFVAAKIAKLVNSSPDALDTLQELAEALGNDPNFSATVMNLIGQKLSKDQNGADIPDKQRFIDNLGLRSAQKSGLAGMSSGLKITTTGTSHPISIIAKEVCLKNADDMQMTTTSLALSLNLSASGVNGLDTGELAPSTWYAVWVISNGTTIAALGSISETAPKLPPGYTYAGRVGWVRTDSSANRYPLSMVQVGKSAQYKLVASSNVTNLPIMASGISTTPAAVSISAFAPPSAGKISLTAGITGAGFVGFAPSSAYSTTPGRSYLSVASPNGYPFAGGYVESSPVPTASGEMVIESGSVYYVSSGSQGILECLGWEEY